MGIDALPVSFSDSLKKRSYRWCDNRIEGNIAPKSMHVFIARKGVMFCATIAFVLLLPTFSVILCIPVRRVRCRQTTIVLLFRYFAHTHPSCVFVCCCSFLSPDPDPVIARRQRQLWSPLRDWTEEVRAGWVTHCLLVALSFVVDASVVVVVIGTLDVVEGKYCCSCANGCVDSTHASFTHVDVFNSANHDFCTPLSCTIR